ncbi:SH3 domain-containing protein [Streptomyces sp. RKND-216]|uniref:SH3 domain-containing protein n=1 Tax=Streptomyces sp. RKND-216 TaxID=2562581 RepID=UPI00109DEFF1|nr:SH3 domain-containing protein [Streptomyces sp. RKND-216]THA23832.1 SH3 domain-containing protein [Streptomyces sp. RKND-216]
MKIGTRIKPAARAGVVAAAVIGSLAATVAPAGAAPARPYGTVVTPAGLSIREYPSTDSSVTGGLGYRAQVGLRCKVRAQNIDGNTLWYQLRSSGDWVTARYVDNTGFVPYCKDV